jgi:ubiquinone/menaquinone biosynthesis C-methylase UbiE
MFEALLEPLLRWLRRRQVIGQIPPQSEVLDVGCGKSAALLWAIAPQIKKGVGIDFKVPNTHSKNIETKQVTLDIVLPFADASFDVVTMLAVLEHIEYEQEILQEVHRVLRKDGKLILTVPSIWAQPILEFLAYRLKIVDEAEIRDHKRYYDRSRLRKALIEKAEFQDFQHQYFQLWMNNFCTVVKP